VLAAEPPNTALRGDVAIVLELVCDEAVAELGVLVMDVDDGVDQMGVFEITQRAGLALPLVEGLGREAEHPAGQPHRESLGGQVTDQRELHFERASRAK
jgi:hypothetical protein